MKNSHVGGWAKRADAKTSLSLVIKRYSDPLLSVMPQGQKKNLRGQTNLMILPLMKVFLPPPKSLQKAICHCTDEKNPGHASASYS